MRKMQVLYDNNDETNQRNCFATKNIDQNRAEAITFKLYCYVQMITNTYNEMQHSNFCICRSEYSERKSRH